MTRHLVDPELLPGLDFLPAFDLSEETLPQIRALMAGFIPAPEDYARDDVAMTVHTIPGHTLPDGPDAPGIDLLVYTPRRADGPLPALLHIHGGGYVLGDPRLNGPAHVRTAAEVGCVVVAPRYRLAPETPAPGGLEDCYAALAWLHDHADTLGVDRTRIAVGGESAGGGLAAALALLARDRAQYPVSFQLLIYPMLDDRSTTADAGMPHVGAFVWDRRANAFGWQALLGRVPGGADTPAYCAAARATDLAGLPPAYICVGSLDLFLEEDVEYAMRLLKAGVPVELHVIPGAYHGFEAVPTAAVVLESERERRAALARAFRSR